MHSIRIVMSGHDDSASSGETDQVVPGAVHAERDDEEGQGMVEYGLILVLIALVVVFVVGLIGHQLQNVFSNVSSGLGR